MMALTEKQIIEKAQALINRAECGGNTHSFLAPLHRENACALRELLTAYVRLKVLEQESLNRASMPLSELLSVSTGSTKEPEVFRAKNHGREP